MANLSKFLLGNLELVLAGMSLPVIGAVHLLLSVRFDRPWEVTTAVAVSVGVLHGILSWLVRARQRSVRLELLQRMAAILQKERQGASAYAICLALAQFPALVREPLMVKTATYTELSSLRGRSA